MSRFALGFGLLIVLHCLGPASGEVNQKAIDEVRAGKVKVAQASWWGFDPEDSTAALQAAIDSGAPRLIVENLGRPWIVTPIRLASNQEIVFERGVEILAKQGAFIGTGDCLFSAAGKENVVLSGYGATFRMRRSDYDRAPYKKGEWRHALQLMSCRNVRVEGLTLTESGGDGLYLGTGTRGVSNRDIVVKDVICDSNYRQGISVITADGLLIENTVMRRTAGTPPMAGIDFEPNETAERLRNVVMRNCSTEENRGCGYAIYIPTLNGSSEPVSLRFEGCSSSGDGYAALALTTGNSPEAAVKGAIEFSRCVFRESQGPGVIVSDKPYNGCRLRFEGCSVVNVGAKSPAQSPIVLSASQTAAEPVGGIEFRDCVVQDDLDRKPMAYQDSAGGLELRDVGGNLVLERKGQRTPVELTRSVLATWMPVLAMKALPRLRLADFTFQPPAAKPTPPALAFGFASVRGRVRAVVWAGQGESVAVKVRYQQVGKYAGNPTPVVVTGPSGREVARVTAQFLAETEVAFAAPETGLHRLEAEVSPNSMAIVSSSHPVSLTGDGQSVDLIGTQGQLFFWVPAGATEFAVRVVGEGGEGIKTGLYDATGKLVEEKDDISAMHQFLATLPQPSTGEVWSLRLAKATNLYLEDYHVDLRGLPPLLAPSKEAVLLAVRRPAAPR